jgi:hypothetical protein
MKTGLIAPLSTEYLDTIISLTEFLKREIAFLSASQKVQISFLLLI